jgi:prepilin-type processing-associated H-X9-DG protein/prepilin-type N-terminal cleavage/methylation domain-containing protein
MAKHGFAPIEPLAGKKRPCGAFTLIELLVVISIVGLLAAMLMPTLRQSRESARAAVCGSNLRQIGMATQMYLDDYGRYFPYYSDSGADRFWYFGLESPFSPTGPPGTRHIDLTKAKLYPYLQKLHGIEVCPSYDYRSPKWRQKFDQITYGYGYNYYGLVTNTVGKTPSQLRDPARIVCFADTAQINTFQTPASSSNPMLEEWYYVSYKTAEPADVHFRHNGRANVLFCDGHVESLPMAPGTLDAHLPGEKVGRLNPNGDTSLFW